MQEWPCERVPCRAKPYHAGLEETTVPHGTAQHGTARHVTAWLALCERNRAGVRCAERKRGDVYQHYFRANSVTIHRLVLVLLKNDSEVLYSCRRCLYGQIESMPLIVRLTKWKRMTTTWPKSPLAGAFCDLVAVWNYVGAFAKFWWPQFFFLATLLLHSFYKKIAWAANKTLSLPSATEPS